jgi:hypothetical protein
MGVSSGPRRRPGVLKFRFVAVCCGEKIVKIVVWQTPLTYTTGEALNVSGGRVMN